MKDLLNRLYQHEKLSREEAKEVVLNIGHGKYQPTQVASFLTVFNMRSITVDELQGFRDAMLDLCVKVDLDEYGAMDIVGTGGDGKDTFNISTTTAFVVAGCGVNVAKHGNYGVSSGCGSSNVLEHLGISFSNDPDDLKRSLDASGFCMMHAPLFHPAMKHVAPIRKEMSVRTFFNMLGPLTNPSRPKKQFLGVFSLSLARLYAYLQQNAGIRYSVIYSLDGYDEISLTSPVKVIDNQGEKLLYPEDLGFQKVDPKQLSGGNSVEDAAKTLISILKNECTKEQKDVVLANAALALCCADETLTVTDAIARAKESIDSGKAFDRLKSIAKNL